MSRSDPVFLYVRKPFLDKVMNMSGRREVEQISYNIATPKPKKIRLNQKRRNYGYLSPNKVLTIFKGSKEVIKMEEFMEWNRSVGRCCCSRSTIFYHLSF